MLIRDGGAENAVKTADVRWNVWLMSKYKSASLTLTRGWNRTRSNRLLTVSKAAAHCVTTRETKNLQSLDKDNCFSEKQDFWFCDVEMKKIWCHPTSLTSLRRLKQLLVFYGCQGSSAGPSVCQRGRETLSGRKSDRKSNRTYQKTPQEATGNAGCTKKVIQLKLQSSRATLLKRFYASLLQHTWIKPTARWGARPPFKEAFRKLYFYCTTFTHSWRNMNQMAESPPQHRVKSCWAANFIRTPSSLTPVLSNIWKQQEQHPWCQPKLD